MKTVTHSTGRVMMTAETAIAVHRQFAAIGGFSDIRLSEFGCDSGCYCVELWSVNPAAGNRTLHKVDLPPQSEAEYQAIARQAKGVATKRDKAALDRIAAGKEQDRLDD
jgi:hypothetical protein